MRGRPQFEDILGRERARPPALTRRPKITDATRPAQLLVYNRSHQRFEHRLAKLDRVISHAVNNFAREWDLCAGGAEWLLSW